MRDIFTMWKNNLKIMVFKNIIQFLILVIAPVVITVIFSTVVAKLENEMIVAIIDEDKTKVSEYIETIINDNDKIKVINIDKNKLKDFITNADAMAFVVIENGFEKNIIAKEKQEIKVIGKEGDDFYKMISAMIDSNINNIENLALVANGDKVKFDKFFDKYKNDNLKFESISNGISNNEYSQSRILLGYLLMVMFFKALFGADRINKDKEGGAFERIMISGVSTFKYYLANLLASFTVLSIQCFCTLLPVMLFLKIDFGISFISMLLILMLTSFMAVSIGTLCICITKNTQQATIVGNIFTVLMLMISGAFVPKFMFSDAIDKISRLTPVRWVVDIIENMQIGSSLSLEWKNIILVILFSIVCLLLATFLAKNKDKKYKVA